MFKNKGITFRLVVTTLVGVVFIFVAVLGYNYWVSRALLLQQTESNAMNLALATVNKIESVLHAVEKVPSNIGHFLEHNEYTKESINAFLEMIIAENDEIFGGTIAFEPYGFKPDEQYYAPYYFKENGELRFSNLGSSDYHYFDFDWYNIPKEEGKAVWSEPYFDEGGGNIIVSTYSVPFYRSFDGGRKFVGVVTVDIDLKWLQELVSSIKIYDTGYAFLVSNQGRFITHPNKDYIMNGTIFDRGERTDDDTVREIAENIMGGNSGFVELPGENDEPDSFLYYASLPSNNWKFAVLFPEPELLAGLYELERVNFILIIVGIALVLLLVIIISRTITKPLRQLVPATEKIASGNLDFNLPPHQYNDEVGRLADSINDMKFSLKNYIADLTKTTAIKERIESELKIAHDIQMDILPKIFPPFPHRPEIDIYAQIKPAKEVGGDFYDFFFLDDDHIAVVIGDVSGKGVPASLLMAVTSTLFKAKVSVKIEPSETLAQINRDLKSDTKSNMFVTVFLGILTLSTGRFIYSNGGHNIPYLLKRDKTVLEIENTHSLVLGSMKNFSFETKSLVLAKGDGLCFFTDGVTEAMNHRDDMYSDERLAANLRTVVGQNVKSVTETIFNSVQEFIAKAPQSDDITVVVLKYYGKGHREE